MKLYYNLHRLLKQRSKAAFFDVILLVTISLLNKDHTKGFILRCGLYCFGSA